MVIKQTIVSLTKTGTPFNFSNRTETGQVSNVYAAGTVVLRYLESLFSPILTVEQVCALHSVQSATDLPDEICIEYSQKFVESLPPHNSLIVEYITRFTR